MRADPFRPVPVFADVSYRYLVIGISRVLRTRAQLADACINARQLGAAMEQRIAALVENLFGFSTSHAHSSIGSNAKLAQTLLRDINFVYSVCHSPTLLVATRMTLTST